MLIKRQLRITFLLLLIIIGCVGSGLYIRSQDMIKEAIITAMPITQEIDMALRRFDMRGHTDKANVQTASLSSNGQKAALAFWGLGNEEMTGALLKTLDQYGISATFFVTGSDATSYPQSMTLIGNSGQSIGIASVNYASDISGSSSSRIISDISRTSAAIQSITGVRPTQTLALNEPDDVFLGAVYACSIGTVVVPTKIITISQTQTLPVQEFMEGLARGSILCVRMESFTANTIDTIKQLSEVLAQTDFALRAESLLNGDFQPAQEQRRVYTTERAAAFTFSGLGNQAELSGVLKALQEVGGKGTFFVTRDDLINYPMQVRSILDEGNALGISVQTARFTSAAAILEEILSTKEELQTDFSYTSDVPVRPLYGTSNDLLKKACGAGGFTLLSAMVNAVQIEDIRKTDPAVVLAERFPEQDGFLQRGEIVHFQMKQYQYSDAMLGDLVRLVATQRNMYTLKPAMDVLNNKEYTYTYPVAKADMLPEVRDAIHPGQLTGSTMNAIISRYIGIDWVNSSAYLPGFNSREIIKLNKKGLVANDQNMIFLSFDDWGTDKSITSILDVLRAHEAKATFFIRTEYVAYNPNLLRAIAMEGHAIGSHTRTHFPLSNDLGSGKRFSELTDQQVALLEQDLVESYQNLQDVIGDIKIDGRPALSKLFRPPTLAVSKSGLSTVLDCGFSYSVSGSYTTQDYKAKSAAGLASSLQFRSRSGAVLIMHMSDNSVYTADALEIYLSEMELQPKKMKYRYATLSEVLK